MTITLEGLITIAETLAADYTSFEAGHPIAVPEVDATLANQKVAFDLVVTKVAAGTQSGLNLTAALSLFADFAEFEAGKTVSLPAIDLVIGAAFAINLQLSVHKV